MRTFVLLLACLAGLLSLPPSARAQNGAVTIEVSLEETTYLPGEDIVVAVRISNLSGRALTFGTNDLWLSFYAESKAGQVVGRVAPVPVRGEFTLESAKAGTKWWNIQPYFDFDEPGPYNLYAELRLQDWKERILSEPVALQIQPSRKVWSVTFGVPPEEGSTNNTPEFRRYALQSAARAKERKLYARVTSEDETRIFRVVLLDRLLSFSNPEQQLDSRSRLHVLFQTGGSVYTYCVLEPSGNLVVKQRFEIVQNVRPRLVKDASGLIVLRGGRRLPTPGDIPPYIPPPPEIAATNALPVPTNAPTKAELKARKSELRRAKAAERKKADDN